MFPFVSHEASNISMMFRIMLPELKQRKREWSSQELGHRRWRD